MGNSCIQQAHHKLPDLHDNSVGTQLAGTPPRQSPAQGRWAGLALLLMPQRFVGWTLRHAALLTALSRQSIALQQCRRMLPGLTASDRRCSLTHPWPVLRLAVAADSARPARGRPEAVLKLHLSLATYRCGGSGPRPTAAFAAVRVLDAATSQRREWLCSATSITWRSR